ncbi:glycosyl transferase [Elstera cyanobacteriorum]|uniref:Glycosyltransferase 2-like domain-containing protein n=1 Tax=Elstera cyanobacteriorum TaxID=2022747 RepID=A0A255XYX6_9PROT|nr:glycosyltransferase family 2 protein [Elstera cyanobacteriorum]OYQ22237.1 hypothetical protein CHR90_00525 [Elstera cyanobacteriorum]GGA02273.1 glycosyl transferase [Elstera cyanobacteriorum]
MSFALEALTLTAAGLTAYHHAGYARLLRVLTRQKTHHLPPTPAEFPKISLVIPAYCEEAHIAAKIANCDALLYPADKLEIVILDDGSPDRTAVHAAAAIEQAAMARSCFRLIRFPENRGKVAALNSAMPLLTGEIVMFSDTSALLSIDALYRLAAWFNDPSVSLVSSSYQLLENPGAGEGRWWRGQTETLYRESLLAAPIGAHGAGFAVRRQSLATLPADTVNDDFILAMTAILKGGRGVYDPEITSLELEATAIAQDFRRRIRIGTGNAQQLVRLRGLLNPRRPVLAFLFLSGKASRPLMPLIMLTALLGAAVLASEGSLFFALLAVAQTAGYALGLAAPALAKLPDGGGRLGQGANAIHYLIKGHVAGLIGAMRFLLGRHRRPWRRVSLPSPSSK